VNVPEESGGDRSKRAGTSWLVVGLVRGVVLPVVYGMLWMVGGWIADLVVRSETGIVQLGFYFAVFGIPFGAAAGVALGAICAAVDWKTARRLTRRRVAVWVVGSVMAGTALVAATALDFWAIYVGGPGALGLASLWVWPLPQRRPQQSDTSRVVL
jgi:hypothetical protein